MTRPTTARDSSAIAQGTRPGPGSAFLLAQLGAHAAGAFARRVEQLGINPAQAGVLRLVAQHPGRSQQALAEQLGVAPSKVVALIDGLQQRGLIERTRSSTDRRQYALHLTDSGRQLLANVGAHAAEHETELTTALDADERRHLLKLLQRIADQQGLTPGVHPGYKTQPDGTPRP